MPAPPAQSYIDFEIAEGERARTAALYERLLNRTTHVKVCDRLHPSEAFKPIQGNNSD